MKYLTLLFLYTFSLFSYAETFEVGQVWSYNTRTTESKSTLTILKIENYTDLGEVIHIRVDNINMINPVMGNEIPHLPFKSVGINKSVIKLVSNTTTLPEYKDGYNTWRAAYDAGKAGAFESTVKDTIVILLGADWVQQK